MVDQIAFRNALACFASGVTVVTAPGDGRGPVGVTVSAFCSLSLEPPLILVCLDNRTGCIAHFLESGSGFAVNVLAADQRALSDAFAGPQTFDLHGHGFAAGATGSYILNLKREVVENLPIAIPPLPQQQHIADLDLAVRGERAILTKLIDNRAAEMTAIAQQLLAPAFQRPEQRAS